MPRIEFYGIARAKKKKSKLTARGGLVGRKDRACLYQRIETAERESLLVYWNKNVQHKDTSAFNAVKFCFIFHLSKRSNSNVNN